MILINHLKMIMQNQLIHLIFLSYFLFLSFLFLNIFFHTSSCISNHIKTYLLLVRLPNQSFSYQSHFGISLIFLNLINLWLFLLLINFHQLTLNHIKLCSYLFFLLLHHICKLELNLKLLVKILIKIYFTYLMFQSFYIY